MQLLFQRTQESGIFSATFRLWAKFECTEEEAELISRYNVRKFILAEGNRYRDIVLAAKAAIVLVVCCFVVGFVLFGLLRALAGIPLYILLFALSWWGIYRSIREEIRVKDILDGRTFTCRSVDRLLFKEQKLSEMAKEFRYFLELTKTWGGRDVLEIGLEEKSKLRLIEAPRYAAE